MRLHAGGGGALVIDAIDDALIVAGRNPVIFARASRRGLTCRDLTALYDAWLMGFTTWAMFSPDGFDRGERSRRRSVGKGQRRARKANR